MVSPFSRSAARQDGLVPGFASRADLFAALRTMHLKPSELQLLFRCSRGVADKLMTRPDFPPPFDLTGDGHNLRFSFDEVIAYRDSHRREIRALAGPRTRRRPSAEAAVREGLAALRGDKAGGPTGFR
jgi:hypothetical protein